MFFAFYIRIRPTRQLFQSAVLYIVKKMLQMDQLNNVFVTVDVLIACTRVEVLNRTNKFCELPITARSCSRSERERSKKNGRWKQKLELLFVRSESSYFIRRWILLWHFLVEKV